jgi:hypothetical protein
MNLGDVYLALACFLFGNRFAEVVDVHFRFHFLNTESVRTGQSLQNSAELGQHQYSVPFYLRRRLAAALRSAKAKTCASSGVMWW